MRQRLGRIFARFTTNIVVRIPGAWRLFRGLIRKQFDTLAPEWDAIRMEDHLAAYERALEGLPVDPKRALDVGTGTGDGAVSIARHFAGTEVVGVDLAEEMLVRARAKVPQGLSGRVHFEAADAAHLPYDDESFDLIAHANMIPFFDEVARVLRPGGWAMFAFSSGDETPIYVPFERLRRELERRGFTEFADFQAARGTALLARKRPAS